MDYSLGLAELFSAIKKGDIDKVNQLLDSGASIESRYDGYTPLLWAIVQNQIACFDLLVSRGADLFACAHKPDVGGLTPLYLAIKMNRPDFIRRLIETKPTLLFLQLQDWHGALSYSVINEHIDCLRILLAHLELLDLPDLQGRTPLMMAVLMERSDFVEALLDAGANSESACVKGRTPLFIAAENGCLEMVELLVSRGADIYTRDAKNRDIMDAATSECRAVIEQAHLHAKSKFQPASNLFDDGQGLVL